MTVKTWITSDLHFGHGNILKFQAATRPYNSIEQMNEDYITQWNKEVSPGDRVFILGDFAFMNEDDATNVAGRLNGNKILVKGNHDAKLVQSAKFRSQFEFVAPYWEESYTSPEGKYLLVMFHFPILEWNRCHRGAIHFYGHLHGKPSGLEKFRAMDVGVDSTLRVVTSMDNAVGRVKNNDLILHGDGA